MFPLCYIRFFCTWGAKNRFVCHAGGKQIHFLKLNVTPVLYTVFFTWGSKNEFVCPVVSKKIIFFLTC